MSRPASLPAAVAAQAIVELRLTARRGENVLVTIVVPAVVLVFFASLPLVTTSTDRSVDFLLPGALALAVIATGLVSLGIATAYERNYGVLKRLGGSPLTRGGLLAAKLVAVLVIEIIVAAVLVGIAAAFLGWSPGPDGSPVVVAAALVLGTISFAALGMLLAGALRAEATLALANGLFIACLLLGGIVLPIDHLPDLLAAAAGLLPAAALSEAFRIGFGAAETGASAAAPFAILAVWGAAAVAATARTFRWE